MTLAQDSLKGRDFLTLADYSREEIQLLLDVAADLKKRQRRGESHRQLEGKTLGLIFQKSSTRTRVSFEVGIYQLGGYPLFLSSRDLQLGRGETVADTARVLSRYLDGIMIRTFAQSEVEELACNASIPVINGLTDLYHPCQVLADLLTIQEKLGRLQGIKLAYVGDGNNMAHSLLLGGALTGLEVRVAAPPAYQPQAEVVERARNLATQSGSNIMLTTSPREAVAGVDVVYTDVWASMGQEAEQEQRERAFAGFQINSELLQQARPGALFLHCLPAHRGQEVSEEVLEGEQSLVWDQAENRLHAQKAILALLLQ